MSKPLGVGETKEFWPFSLETYRADGVESACLSLQDDYGLDVNCLLFCCWAGATGYGVLSDQELALMVDVSQDWNVAVVQPLRQVRRVLKDKIEAAEGPEAHLRQAVKDLELEAEWHEQRLLSDLLERAPEFPASRTQAKENFENYIKCVGQAADGRLNELFGVLINASFTV